MAKQTIETVRQSISIITKILSGRGMRVTQSGTRAYVESIKGVPTRVNIPYIPDNASDELMLAINGFLDHEVAHVLFTNFKDSTTDKFKNQTVFSIYNAIEDCRIEALMRAKFAGSKTNLNGVSEFFIEKHLHPEFEKAKESGIQQEIVSSLFVAAIRAWSGQDIFSKYMSDKWHIMKPLKDKIDKMIPKIATVSSTSEVVSLAHTIYDLLTKDEKTGGKGETPEDKGESKTPKEKKPEESEKESAKDDESEDEGQSSEESGGKDENHESDPGENEEESDSDEGSVENGGEDEGREEESGEDSEDDADNESDDDGGEEDFEESERSEDDGKNPDDGEESEDEGAAQASSEEDDTAAGDFEGVEASLNFDEVAKSEGMSESVATLIAEEVSENIGDSEYKIFTTDFDSIEPFNIDDCDHGKDAIIRQLGKIEEESRKVSGALQKTLERLVRAQTASRNLPGKRSGRVNPSSLFRLKTGDDRVFRQKDIGKSNEVAVSLLVDNSGSMYGEKMKVAMEGAFALSDVLTKLGISNEVIGFTTLRDNPINHEIAKERENAGIRIPYSRTEPLYMPIYKGFGERFGIDQKMRIAAASMSGEFMCNNIDGECIRIAAKRLISMTKEKGKQVIVLSDGAPAGFGSYSDITHDLKKAIDDVEKMGVKTIGIGILNKSVKRYYKNHIVINDIHELPSLIVKELKELLIG